MENRTDQILPAENHAQPQPNPELDAEEGLVSNRFLRGLLIILGTLSLGLGIIGIVLPLLPTTPLLLLAAVCYSKSSTRLNNWLLNHRLFGYYIRNYREGQGLPLKVKAKAIAFMWTTILVTIIFFVENIHLQGILIVIPFLVTIYLMHLPTLREPKPGSNPDFEGDHNS